MKHEKLEREYRYLSVYAVAVTIAVIVMFAMLILGARLGVRARHRDNRGIPADSTGPRGVLAEAAGGDGCVS